MDGLVTGAGVDHVYINGAVTLKQARMTSSWVSLTNQFFLISDWLPNLPEEHLDILKRTMAPHQAVARPHGKSPLSPPRRVPAIRVVDLKPSPNGAPSTALGLT